jgi:hypothetical protein
LLFDDGIPLAPANLGARQREASAIAGVVVSFILDTARSGSCA